MTKWPDADGSTIRQHLLELRLRPASVQTYQPMLAEFQQFVVDRSPMAGISRSMMEDWLRHRATFSQSHTILQRLWPIDRFLDWLTARGLIASNPLEDLRKSVGTRDTAEIVRALLSPDRDTALAALKPVPRFASKLGPLMQDYVALKQSLGFRYRTEELQLLRLDRFLQEHPDLAGEPISRIVEESGKTKRTPQHLYECAMAGRLLAKALHRVQPSISVPKMDWRLNQQARRGHRRPYIFSESDVSLLLETALSFPSPRTPGRPLMLHTMLVLAYCLGLRVGEIVRLRVGDYDAATQTVDIRETKFFKSRRLPVTATVADCLNHYLKARSEGGVPADSSSPLFWQAHTAEAYRYPTLRALLVQVIRRAGFKPDPGAVGPRIHDLRHSMVVNRIQAWYREGINPQDRLPYLVTYLGHKDIHSTLVYITITQEIMQHASERFRSFGAHALHAAAGGDECK